MGADSHLCSRCWHSSGWLADNYADIQECFIRGMHVNLSGKPTYYDRKTFVDGCTTSFFAVNEHFAPEPEQFYHSSYFVWLPHLLVGHITCPNCVACSHHDDNGQPIKICSLGWPKAPYCIVDLYWCIYLINYWYYCWHCRKTYASWSPALLSALPWALRLKFLFHLTHHGGLLDQVVALLWHSFLHGIGPVPFANMPRINHICYYEHLQLEYLETVYAQMHSAAARFLPCFWPLVGEFANQDGYAGFVVEINDTIRRMTTDTNKVRLSFGLGELERQMDGMLLCTYTNYICTRIQ